MEITVESIKTIRSISNEKLSISECKTLLLETGGDVEKATELLRKKGIIPYEKKKSALDALKWREPYKLGELITIFANDYNEKTYSFAENLFNLYTKGYAESASEGLVCYLDDIEAGTLDFFYYGALFEDVMINALSQKKQPSMDEYIAALDYYNDHDAFLDL